MKSLANQKAHWILDASYNTFIQAPGHENNRRVQLQKLLTDKKYKSRWMPYCDLILSFNISAWTPVRSTLESSLFHANSSVSSTSQAPCLKILTKKMLGSVRTARGSVAISAATKTTNWVRTELAAESMKGALETAIEKNEGILPAGTAEVCTRYVVTNSRWCWRRLYKYMY